MDSVILLGRYDDITNDLECLRSIVMYVLIGFCTEQSCCFLLRVLASIFF